MICKRTQNGFTLVEILIAMALIATILSMVFSSYFVTSRSAQACQTRIAMCDQGQATLDQMARQIRCAYAGIIKDEDLNRSGTPQKRIIRQENMNYFTGGRNASKGEILRFVTTYGYAETKEKPEKGLFEVIYRFDKRAGTLLLSQRHFIGATKKTPKKDWRPIAENVERFELEFFNGQKWLDRWDFKDQMKLPSAVRMEIGYRDENNRVYDYSTVAHVTCRNHSAGTHTETLVSVDKQ